LAVLTAAALGAPWVTPYDPAAQDLSVTARPPSLTPIRGHVHLLGTDQLGRDILSRLLVGLRISLLVALMAVPLSMLLGLATGMVTGYRGGWFDLALMRLVDAQLAIPLLLLMVAVVAALGSGLPQIVMVLVIAGWPTYARVVRAEVLALRDREFVAAARAVGASDARILARHAFSTTRRPRSWCWQRCSRRGHPGGASSLAAWASSRPPQPGTDVGTPGDGVASLVDAHHPGGHHPLVLPST
jgi:peptide/nickel transport system permease protein